MTTNKHDSIDAEAIAEAVGRPRIKYRLIVDYLVDPEKVILRHIEVEYCGLGRLAR